MGGKAGKALAVYLVMSATGAALWLTAVSAADVDGWPLAALIASEALVITASRPLERHLKGKKEEEEKQA